MKEPALEPWEVWWETLVKNELPATLAIRKCLRRTFYMGFASGALVAGNRDMANGTLLAWLERAREEDFNAVQENTFAE